MKGHPRQGGSFSLIMFLGPKSVLKIPIIFCPLLHKNMFLPRLQKKHIWPCPLPSARWHYGWIQLTHRVGGFLGERCSRFYLLWIWGWDLRDFISLFLSSSCGQVNKGLSQAFGGDCDEPGTSGINWRNQSTEGKRIKQTPREQKK